MAKESKMAFMKRVSPSGKKKSMAWMSGPKTKKGGKKSAKSMKAC